MSPLRGLQPLTLFSLWPMNQMAESAAADPLNYHVSQLERGITVIDIGFQIRTRSCTTLATIGRGDVDVYVPEPYISKVQCSFEIDLNTHVVMLYDRSFANTTQVFGDDSVPFEHGRPCKVVIKNKLNTCIGMGGSSRRRIEFRVQWHLSVADAMNNIRQQNIAALTNTENPRLARTIDVADTILPSRPETRIHTQNQHQLKMRYAYVDAVKLGSGQFRRSPQSR